MRGPLVAILAVVGLVAACGGEGASPTRTPSLQDGQPEASATPSPPSGGGQPTPPEGLSIEFETIEAGQQSGAGVDEPQLFRIDTQTEWEEFWSRHKSNVMPVPDLPPVDFSRKMVISVVDQVEPSGGYRIEITDVVPGRDSLIVRVSKEAPGPDCLVTDALTQPFHIVRTERSSVMLDLVISEKTYDC